MKVTFGYRCPVSGQVYCLKDTRLTGLGNPPSSPAAQSQFKGAGQFPMSRQLVALEELPAEQLDRVPADMIFDHPQPEPTPDEPEDDA